MAGYGAEIIIIMILLDVRSIKLWSTECLKYDRNWPMINITAADSVLERKIYPLVRVKIIDNNTCRNA